jgi:hypothetical protein
LENVALNIGEAHGAYDVSYGFISCEGYQPLHAVVVFAGVLNTYHISRFTLFLPV